MGLMVVTNISGGQAGGPVSIQLVEVPEDSPVPGQPVAMPQGNTVLNLNTSLEQATNYPSGSQWNMQLSKVDDKGAPSNAG